MKYAVEIKETWIKVVVIDAENEIEATNKVAEKYKNADINSVREVH